MALMPKGVNIEKKKKGFPVSYNTVLNLTVLGS